MVTGHIDVGQVRLATRTEQPCREPRDLLTRSVPVELIFQIKEPITSQADALEVELMQVTTSETDPVTLNLSGRVYGRYGCDHYLLGTFQGYYHPEIQTGRLSITPNAPSL